MQIGMGYDISAASSTNWKFICASSVITAPIDLTTLPRNVSSVYRLRIYSPPLGSSIFVTIETMDQHPPQLKYANEFVTNIPGGQGVTNMLRPMFCGSNGSAGGTGFIIRYYRGYGELYI